MPRNIRGSVRHTQCRRYEAERKQYLSQTFSIRYGHDAQRASVAAEGYRQLIIRQLKEEYMMAIKALDPIIAGMVRTTSPRTPHPGAN